MYNFLKKYNLTKLTPLVVKRLKRSISIKKKMDKLSKKLPPQKKYQAQAVSQGTLPNLQRPDIPWHHKVSHSAEY